jgi:hypothetical protein
MQDNLDFLQYTKRYWDKYYPGGEYDALARRKGQGPAAPISTGGGATRRPAASGAGPRTRTPNTGGAGASAAVLAENSALKETVAGLERERDFYFSKLRDIELLIQQELEAKPELEQNEDGILKQIQTILYSTEVSSNLLLVPMDNSNAAHRRVSRYLRRWRASWPKRRRFEDVAVGCRDVNDETSISKNIPRRCMSDDGHISTAGKRAKEYRVRFHCTIEGLLGAAKRLCFVDTPRRTQGST